MSGRGAERILILVEWMASQANAIALSDAVAALDLPKSSTLALLRILVEAGYARREANGLYRLCRLPGEPDDTYRAWGTLARLTNAVLNTAVQKTEESAFLAVLGEDNRVRYISKLMPEREIRYDRDITVSRSAHQVTSGIVLLTGLTPERLAAYAESSAEEAGDPSLRNTILANVEDARAAGYAVNLRGVVEGAAGVAAPVTDSNGRLRAAFNIAGPADRMAANIDQIISVTRECAAQASAALTNFRPRWPDR